MFGASSELASVMEFGFYCTNGQRISCSLAKSINLIGKLDRSDQAWRVVRVVNPVRIRVFIWPVFVQLLLLVLFQVDGDARLPAAEVVVENSSRCSWQLIDDDVCLAHRCLPGYRRPGHRLQRYRAAATLTAGVIEVVVRLRLAVGDSLVCGVRVAFACVRVASACVSSVGRVLRRLRHEIPERVGESGLERVVGERVQKRVDGAVGVTEGGKELEQVHLVRVEGKGNADHHVDLQQSDNTQPVTISGYALVSQHVHE